MINPAETEEIENPSNLAKYTIGILGAISGFVSGYFTAEMVFEPSENTNESIKKLNDIKFWDTVKSRIWFSYLDNIEQRYTLALSDTNQTSTNKDTLFENYDYLETHKKIVLNDLDSRKKFLNSFRFLFVSNQ